MPLEPGLAATVAAKGATVAGILVAAWVLVWLARRVVPPALRTYLSRVRSLRPNGATAETPEDLEKRVATLSGVFVWSIEIFLILVAVFFALSALEIDAAPALASLGVIGIAVGFGAQTLVKDCITGMFILIEDQYRKGDVVRVAGISGQVEDITLRRTILRDLDGTVHSIPNGDISISSNLTREWSRVNLNITVAYGTDVDRAAQVLNQVGEAMASDPVYGPMIVEPPRFLRVDAFTDLGVELKVLGVTRPMKQWDVMGEFRRRALAAFAQAGIEIPQRPRLVVTRELGTDAREL